MGPARAGPSDDAETCAESAEHRAGPEIEDLLPDLASMRASGARATDFFRDVWGDAPMRWRVRPETLRALRAGFRNGDVSALIGDCRDEANDAYDDDDAREMTDRTKPPLRHTLSLPFCFAPGAHALRNSVLRVAYDAPELEEDREDVAEVRAASPDDPERSAKAKTKMKPTRRKPTTNLSGTNAADRPASTASSSARLRFATDVDVGVYASPERGVEASWHYDANHNVTVQLYGEKTWFVTPGGGGGDGGVNQSRGLDDAPRNGREVGDIFDSSATRVFELAPGDAIYVPPGVWHRVAPKSAEAPAADEKNADGARPSSPLATRGGGVTEAVCLSVDVRVANVPRARWTCESLFHAMAARDDVVQTKVTIRTDSPRRKSRRRGEKAVSRLARSALDGALALGDDAPERGGIVTQARANRDAVSCLVGSAAAVARLDQPRDASFGTDRAASSSPEQPRRARAFWYPPRLAPYQPEISDGADLRASLGFLADAFARKTKWRREMVRAGRYAERATVTWHPMVAARVAPEEETPASSDDEDEDAEDAEDAAGAATAPAAFVLDLRAVSGLTRMEYARLGIVMPGCARRDVDRLVETLGAGGGVLSRALPSLFPRARETNTNGGDAGGARLAAEDLLDVLTWCRYLRLTAPAGSRGDPCEPEKRPRRDASSRGLETLGARTAKRRRDGA